MWAMFSASPAKQREVILQGILAQCCFSQLSYLSSAVKELIKIDFISVLPAEISYKVLCFLDTNSLTKAAQVSRKWRQMSDDDQVWHNMCQQHIDKKCKKCGWGLPLLEKQRLRDHKRELQIRATRRGLNEWSPKLTPVPDEYAGTDMMMMSLNGSGKRNAESDELEYAEASKRQCVKAPPKKVPWKDVYKDRFKISQNWKYNHYDEKIFRGHTNGVMCLQFNDKILVTGSYDCSIKIWDIETRECLQTLVGHTSAVRALQFDNSKLISGSLDSTIKVWDMKTYQCKSTYPGHRGGVIAVNFEGNTLASGSCDADVRIWKFGNDSGVSIFRGHTDWVNSVKLHLASRTVFSASDDLTIRLWDLDTGNVLRVFEGHMGQVQQVFLLPPEFEEPDEAEKAAPSPSPDPQLSGQSENKDMFDDWPAGRPLPPRNILTASLDSHIRLWSVPTGKTLKTYFGNLEGVWAVAGDNLRVVSAGQDKSVRVWDPRTTKCDNILWHEGPATCVGLSDCQIASGNEDGTARIWSYKSNDVDALSSPAPTPYT
jgi:F-box/WD-40 domain protein MET30